MTVEQLGSIAGVILSLAIAYIPQLAEWYGKFDTAGKARVMGILLVVAALGVFGLSCANVFMLVACTVEGAKDLLGILIAALVANQASFVLLVQPFQKPAEISG
ncbi:MAG: hypothetical protein EHM33_01070 [Chloroflexi bacterium]|nr:MAG: hypothetical protein EHM33_01070 [Chloroflexota bacterium]